MSCLIYFYSHKVENKLFPVPWENPFPSILKCSFLKNMPFVIPSYDLGMLVVLDLPGGLSCRVYNSEIEGIISPVLACYSYLSLKFYIFIYTMYKVGKDEK